MAIKRVSPPPGWYPKRGDVCLFALDKALLPQILSFQKQKVEGEKDQVIGLPI